MLSRTLTAILLPLTMWGLLSSLLLQLIALRETLIAGGTTKLKIATLAFALGIVLIQRLQIEQGKSAARFYALGLGASMALFAAVDAYSWRVPAPPQLVFAANLALFAILWWSGHRLTAACAVDGETARLSAETSIFSRRATSPIETMEGLEDDPDAASAKKTAPPPRPDESEADARLRQFGSAIGEGLAPEAGDTDDLLVPYDVRAFYDQSHSAQEQLRAERRKRQAEEKARRDAGETLWSRRLGRTHPGRALLYFAFVAVPVFGFGAAAEAGESTAQVYTGMRLFLYLWCTLTLLWLASLGQLRAYFEQRRVNLPEVSGMTWIGVGSVIVLLALAAAFLLPQPEATSTGYVRRRMEATFRGWESEHGLRDRANTGGEGTEEGREGTKDELSQHYEEQFREMDKLGDEVLSRETRLRSERIYEEYESMTDWRSTGFRRAFDGFMRVLALLVAIAALAAICIVVVHGLRGMGAGLRVRRGNRAAKKKPARPRRKRDPGEEEGEGRFAALADPFAAGAADGDALVRRMWAATLAMCADRGVAPPKGATPREFVQSRPEPLEGMEDRALWLAELLYYSEFSGRAVPDGEKSNLEAYWRQLQGRAAG